jgi:hypothetical protein
MAEIVQSLFGVTPESYRQAQQDRMDAQALQYARLDPFQQANYAIGRGASGLAGAIGGALGGQDPELQRITRAQQIAGQIDFNSDDSMKQGILALNNAGDPQSAMQLQQILLSQQAKRASIYKDESAGKASLAAAGRERLQGIPNDIQLAREISSLQEQISQFTALPASPERDQALRLASGQLAELQRLTTKAGEKPVAPNIKEVGTAVASGKAVYTYQTADGVQQITFETDADGKQVMKPYVGPVDRTTAKVSATATGAQQDDFAKVLNKKQGEAYSNAINLRDSAIIAVKTFNTLGQLDEQGLISGTFATGRVGATNLLTTLGLVTPANAATLARSENYQKVAGDAILAAIGGKLGAQISDSDRKFIERLVPQLENSAAARRQLIDFMRNKNAELITASNELIDYAETKKTLSGYKPKIPLPKSSAGTYSDLSDDELDRRIKAAQKKQ